MLLRCAGTVHGELETIPVLHRGTAHRYAPGKHASLPSFKAGATTAGIGYIRTAACR